MACNRPSLTVKKFNNFNFHFKTNILSKLSQLDLLGI